MEIRPVPLPATKVDRAPKAAPRDNPAEIVAERPHEAVATKSDRRRADRRRGERGKPVIERRLSAERRRRSIDISV